MSLGYKVIAADMLLEKDLPELGSKESIIVIFEGKGCLIDCAGRDNVDIRLKDKRLSFNRKPFEKLVTSIIEVLS